MLHDPLSVSIDTTLEVSPASPLAPPKPRKRLLKPTERPGEYILELDYSYFIAPFMLCRKKAENAAVFGRKSTSFPAALNWGSCFHLVEELRLRHGHTDAVWQAQQELIAKYFLEHPVPADEYRNAGMMLELYAAYRQLYQYDGWPEAVYEGPMGRCIETPFKSPVCTIQLFGGTIPYAQQTLVEGCDDGPLLPLTNVQAIHCVLLGKIDTVLNSPRGLVVVDHKTTSRGGPEWESAFGLSLQTRGYCYAAKKLGIPVVGAMMNGVICRRPTKTGKGVEFIRPPTFFYSADSLDEYETNLRTYCEDFVHCLTTGVFPQAASSFKSPCPSCEYHSNCRLSRDQRPFDLGTPLYADITFDPTHDLE